MSGFGDNSEPQYGSASPAGGQQGGAQPGYPSPEQGFGQQQPYPQQPYPQPAPAPPPYPAGPGFGVQPHLGPLGSPRSIGVCILLAIVTLGVYPFVWVYKTHKELKLHCGSGMGGGLGLLLYFLAGIATFFIVPNEIESMLGRAGVESRVSTATGFWYFLPIAGPIVWFVKVQGQLNDYWHSLGAVD